MNSSAHPENRNAMSSFAIAAIYRITAGWWTKDAVIVETGRSPGRNVAIADLDRRSDNQLRQIAVWALHNRVHTAGALLINQPNAGRRCHRREAGHS
jgi:hypothetical protein